MRLHARSGMPGKKLGRMRGLVVAYAPEGRRSRDAPPVGGNSVPSFSVEVEAVVLHHFDPALDERV